MSVQPHNWPPGGDIPNVIDNYRTGYFRGCRNTRAGGPTAYTGAWIFHRAAQGILAATERLKMETRERGKTRRMWTRSASDDRRCAAAPSAQRRGREKLRTLRSDK
ncbi:hypothetical protein SKAU_G00373010 [Synaphobranchus kaupii]|uniref:Uncharacterized protein n=1 Tax=Synaphobranchus kaupii TaxID=118154 RepID=A0A9Q1EGF9_SYNKA|nr:hypothetical protein SKAU_G00373010 [Synaphobranchus kaupii]